MSKYRRTLLVAAWLSLSALIAHAQAANDYANDPGALQVANCANCHSCAAPTADAPCLIPCTYSSSEEAAEEVIAPDVVTIGTLSDIYEPVVFNHERHAQMSQMGNGCIDCHHYTAKGLTPACQTCHGGTANVGNLRQPGLRGAYHRQCLGCHREWTGEASCGECHAERRPGATATVTGEDADIVGRKHPTLHPQAMYLYEAGELPPVTFHHSDHAGRFGLTCSDCHQKESCSSCHNTSTHVPRTRTEPHEDCARCHQDRIDNDCASCHSETPLPNFNHARRSGFDLATYHEALTCNQCHEGGDFGGLNASCNTCHAKDWKPENFDHKRTGAVLDDLHLEVECSECHAGFGEKATCTGCHETQPQPFESLRTILSRNDAPQTQDANASKD